MYVYVCICIYLRVRRVGLHGVQPQLHAVLNHDGRHVPIYVVMCVFLYMRWCVRVCIKERKLPPSSSFCFITQDMPNRTRENDRTYLGTVLAMPAGVPSQRPLMPDFR